MEIRVARHRESALHCAVCKDGLKHFSACCEACGTRLHFSCRTLVSGCPTLGCVNAPRSRMQREAARANRLLSDLLIRVVGPRLPGKTAPAGAVEASSAFRNRLLASAFVAASPILLLVAFLTIVSANSIGTVDTKADWTRFRADCDGISKAIKLYRLDTGGYPRNLTDLVLPSGEGPYLDELPVDPWGSPYVYLHHSGHVWEILSYGADGLPGGEDQDEDIVFRVGFGPRD